MDYPDNFETPAFPAGKSIAISRVMAIWSLAAFIIIIFLCGILIWSARSVRMDPFIISSNKDTGDWTLVGQKSGTLEITTAQSVQESVAVKFIKNWFEISNSADANESVWKKCELDECKNLDQSAFGESGCAISCAADANLYSRFLSDVVPDYRSRMARGEIWTIKTNEIAVQPVRPIFENGGNWHGLAKINSSNGDIIDVEIFIKIGQNKNTYQQTFGFYVIDFNAYRMN